MSNLKIRFGFEFDDGRRIIAPFDQDNPITISPDAEPMVMRYKKFDLVARGFDVEGDIPSPSSVTVYENDFGNGGLMYGIFLSDIDGYISWGLASSLNQNSSHKILAHVPFQLISGQHTEEAGTPIQRSQSTEADIYTIYFFPATQVATAPVTLEAWLFGVDT